MEFGQAPDQRQAQTGAAVGAAVAVVNLLEGAHQPGQAVGRDADAAIADGKMRAAIGVWTHAHGDLAAFGGELYAYAEGRLPPLP